MSLYLQKTKVMTSEGFKAAKGMHLENTVHILHEDNDLLGYDAVWSSETSVNFYQTTRRYIPEDSILQIHRRNNLKSIRLFQFLVL
jgi:hypothetical protein